MKKEVNIRLETKEVKAKIRKTKWTIEYGEPVMIVHKNIQKRYDKFNEWLANILIKYQINPTNHEEFIKEVITKYMWEIDSDQTRNEIENLIINNPDIKRDMRRQKLNEMNES